MGRYALIAALVALPAFAQGVVSGHVTLLDQTADGKTTSRADASGVVVYIPDFGEDPPSRPHPEMLQKNKQFVPQVLPVVKGETVDFVNEDTILHNVFSPSRAAGFDGFDLGRYRGTHAVKPITFKKTGIVDLYCDIHESMVATILVLPNRAYAVTGKDGAFTLDQVPAGHHTVYAYIRHGGKASGEVDVQPGKPAKLELTVDVAKASDEHKDRFGQSYASHPKDYENH
jgi:plastocyanin